MNYKNVQHFLFDSLLNDLLLIWFTKEKSKETKFLFWIASKTICNIGKVKRIENFQGNANVFDKRILLCFSIIHYFFFHCQIQWMKNVCFQEIWILVWSITANLKDNYHEIKLNKKENRMCFKIVSITKKNWSNTNALRTCNASIKDEILNGWRK